MKLVIALSNAALADLPIPGPTYERDRVSTGIMHFGVGNFHRSHMAMYLDRFLSEGGEGALEWGICGVGVLPQDEHMHNVMQDQDCLFTLILRHPDGTIEPSVIGSIVDYLWTPKDMAAVFDHLVDPAVRIVSLTVTEGGYLKNAATGEFDPEHPSVQHDLAHPDEPSTAFAYIVEGLRRRRAAGVAPFTVLSCDNLQGNGDVTRQTVTRFAALLDEDLADWIDAKVAFPNCMVDRITPATTDADRSSLAQDHAIQDAWPVPGEPFTQWIVEDHFPAGRPALEAVGVQFVDDVVPYELMKLRLLNASHQAIAYLGAPLGYTLVDETMRDDRIRDFLEKYMAQEAEPTLGELPGIDVTAYEATLVERFSNPAIRDTLVRLATDGANRMATFALPAIKENLEAGRPVPLGAALVAAWAHYWDLIADGTIAGDQVPEDVHAGALSAAAADPRPEAFLELTEIFGDLGQRESFVRAYGEVRAAMQEKGVHAALDEVLKRE